LEIKITFVGDVLFDGEMVKYIEQYRKGNGILDFHSIFAPMQMLFSQSDFVLANLETPISDCEDDYTKKRWEFCTAYEFAEALKESGVDYVSTANNHCLDRGIVGLEKTIKCLDQIGLLHSGIGCVGENREPVIAEIAGVRIALLSYTYGTNAMTNRQYLGYRKNRKLVNLFQEQEGAIERISPLMWYIRRHPGGFAERVRNGLLRRIYPENIGKDWYEKTTPGMYRRWLLSTELRRVKRMGADMTAVYLHVGGQYNCEPNVLTKRMIQWLMKKGCSIVIGNHEHVVHGCIHNTSSNQLATYAIGNFLGSAGTLHEPYDRYAEYSIAVHTYIDSIKKKINKVTFSVLVSCKNDNGTYEVWPVKEWISTLPENIARKKIEDCLTVAKLFSNQVYDRLLDEYLLCMM